MDKYKDEKKEISEKFERDNIDERKRAKLIKFLNKKEEERKKIKKILTKIKKQLLEEMKEKKEKEMFKVERRREIEMQKKGI